MSSIVSIDTRGYDISMGPGVLRVGGGGGLAGNVYINGNVGIGVINPTARLDVSGLIQSSITGASSFAQLIRNTTGEGAGWNSRIFVVPYLSTGGYNNLASLGDVGIIWGAFTGTNGNLVIGPHTATAGGLKIMADGKVGIGTTSPRTALDVVGSASAYNIPKRWQSDILVGGNYSGGLARYYLLGTLKDNNVGDGYGTMNIQGTLGGFTNDSISVIDAMITTRSGIKTSGLLKYYGSNGDDICDIVVYYTGTTGTTSGPQYFVYLKTNIQLSSTVYLYFDLAVTTGFTSTSQTTNSVWIAEPSNTFITTTPTGTNVITSLIASIGNKITIDTDGKVGIGKSTPVATLDVSGVIKTNGGVVIGSGGEFQIEKSATSKTLLIKHTSNPNTPICFYNDFPGGTTRVGIDTTTPASTLDVIGTITTNKMLIRNTDFSYSLATQIYTANTWYQAVPTGILTANMTYIVTLRLTTVGAPFVLTTSFLFQALTTNGGSNNLVGAAVPTAAHDTGASDYQIYVRGKSVLGNVSCGIEFKVSSTTSTGDWVVGVYRII